MYGRHRDGTTIRHNGIDAWKSHPHAQRLEEFAGLVMDGWAFGRMRLGGKSGYKPVDTEAGHPTKARTDARENSSKRDKRRSSHMSTSSSSKTPKTSSSAEKHQKRKSDKKDTAERSSDASGSKRDSSREKSAASVPDDAKHNEDSAVGKHTHVLAALVTLLYRDSAGGSWPFLTSSCSNTVVRLGTGGFNGALQEERDERNVHSSQAKIKVVGLNG